MTNYQKARVKLTNKQVKKLKFAAKSMTGTILSVYKKNYEDEELPHELFLTTRQTTEMPLLTICQQIQNLAIYVG